MSFSQTGRMHLAAFMNAGAQGTIGWRHPDAADNFLSADYYAHAARVLESACFDMAFIPDSLALPRSLGGSFEPAVRWGSGTPRLDPLPVLAIMAAASHHLGLAATVSTGYHQPFTLARTFSTLDHLTHGRAAWNVVTSFQDAEAQNFGEEKLPPRDVRYAKAEEFMEVTAQLWDSWADDALVQDKASGQFGHPDRVRAINHRGEFFNVRGPLGVPRAPQGYPVIVQAGASPAGRDFSARWADVIFCSHASLATAQAFYAEMKQRAAAHGRDPDQLKILPAATPVIGDTKADALAKHHAYAALVTPEAGLSRLSYHVNVDLSRYDLDAPMPSLEDVGVQGHYEEVLEFAEREKLTLREIGTWYGARTEGEMIGTPVEIADRMQAWLDGGAADGFMIQATHMPGAFETFAQAVVPELQRRGLLRTAYEGVTLRDHLGLARPARGAWRDRARTS